MANLGIVPVAGLALAAGAAILSAAGLAPWAGHWAGLVTLAPVALAAVAALRGGAPGFAGEGGAPPAAAGPPAAAVAAAAPPPPDRAAEQALSAALAEAEALARRLEGLEQGDFTARLSPDEAPRHAERANRGISALQTAVDEVLALAGLLAEGDLSTAANGAYKGNLALLRDAVNEILTGLRAIVESAMDSAESIAARSHEMRDAAGEMMRNTGEQAAAVAAARDANAALGEEVRKVGDAVHEMRDHSAETRRVARSGREVSGAAQDAISRMQTDSREIAKILDVINSIAQQTNLLAVNASVEAARAGDAGKGFAVVSAEVQALAGRTAAAAADIREIVKSSSVTVEDCARHVGDCSDLLARIAERVEQAERAAGAIEEACGSQRSALEAGSREMDALAKISRAGEGLSRAGEETARRLDDVAGALTAQLARFRMTDGRMEEEAIERAAEISRRFEAALSAGRITMEALFSTEYEELQGSSPPQYMAPFTRLTDELLPDILESALDIHEGVVFSAAVNRDGYLPTHNRKFSKPPKGDPAWDMANARNRRFFTDRVGLAAGRSSGRALMQAYRRDMGGGKYVTMKDVSAPIMVRGRHWGGLRIGYRPEEAEAAAPARPLRRAG
ncbi:methyl-accepting chemotaxis protein [Rhodovulum sp. DZ06]|uniref:methyl-accepting chemotaxis protein n=1 Tax=Rhodovulum sp. DZ06 TaxID=3425126 RepID=UPI003D32D732